MPKLAFTEENIRPRVFISEDGTYDLTVSGVTEEIKDGNDVWVVRLATADDLEHIERFEFADKWMWKIAAFLRGLGFTVTAGEQEISKEMIIGEHVRADIKKEKWAKGDKSGETMRVKKWSSTGVNQPTAKAPEPSAKPTPTLRKL